jgi:hypothetical protein
MSSSLVGRFKKGSSRIGGFCNASSLIGGFDTMEPSLIGNERSLSGDISMGLVCGDLNALKKALASVSSLCGGASPLL